MPLHYRHRNIAIDIDRDTDMSIHMHMHIHIIIAINTKLQTRYICNSKYAYRCACAHLLHNT